MEGAKLNLRVFKYFTLFCYIFFIIPLTMAVNNIASIGWIARVDSLLRV